MKKNLDPIQDSIKVSKSPDRNTFQANGYAKRLEKDPNDVSAKQMIELWKKWREEAEVQEMDDDWKKNNLEWDLRTTDWILEKARSSDRYAQNIYAALCNMQWQKLELMPILKDEFWSCSWRHAGGIVADMLCKGDYIDWYCSGMGEGLGNGDPDGVLGYVPESHVTEEIRADFQKLGWVPVPWNDD